MSGGLRKRAWRLMLVLPAFFLPHLPGAAAFAQVSSAVAEVSHKGNLAKTGGEAAGGGAATFSFHFERAGVAVPMYTFTVHPDGTGSYVAGDDDAGAAPSMPRPKPQALHLRPESAARIFEYANAANGFRPCESTQKNLASTGIKTLTYVGIEGVSAKCSFNYSDNKYVSALADTFLAFELTLELGQKLEHDHRFDRLGLDQDIRYLVDATKENRAQGLALVTPVLEALVKDQLVIERVRTAAGKLLEQGNLGK